MVKKEEVKKLSARELSGKTIMMIEGVKLTKKLTAIETKSLKTKIELYNKKPTKALLDTIRDILKSEEKKAKETKAVIKKGVKAEVKKEVKKATSKKSTTKSSTIKEEEDVEVNLLDKVRSAHGAGELTDEDIKSLQDLIAKKQAEKKEEAPREEAKQEERKQESSYQRRNEY